MRSEATNKEYRNLNEVFISYDNIYFMKEKYLIQLFEFILLI